MSQAKQSEMFDTPSNHSPYIIEELEIYNWGPFSGRHRAYIDSRGSAIIGQTGSGKTTLVDAIMTLIAARPLYNLASTGGHESDRDLVSYIRGVSGEGNESGDNAHIARNGSTVTALAARFSNGEQQVTLTALFWLDGSSSSMTDLKRLWLFSRDAEHEISHWLALHREGGARAVKQFVREQSNTTIHDSKKAYLAQLQRFFEVGKNAFALLNRAAGLKQLNSIDELFRELVLEDKSAFKRAADVVDGFDVLKEIHQELEIARSQQHALLPIDAEEQVRQRKDKKVEELARLSHILPIWFATQGHQLWQHRQSELIEQLAKCRVISAELTDEQQGQELEIEQRHRFYIEQGGGNIEQLEQQIQQQQKIHRDCRSKSNDYQRLTTGLDLDSTISKESLKLNQQRGEALRLEKQQQLTALEEQRDQEGGALFTTEAHKKSLQTALQEAKENSHSNIPSAYLRFKLDLAEALKIDVDAVAYIAELVEIKSEEGRWRGAIERALGAHRLRLIVPGDQMRQALAWVNRRNNRLHVRLLDAAEQRKEARFLSDGFCHKLSYRKHPQREVVKRFVAGIDRHCVASSDLLHQTPHGMTAEGLMSGRAGQFDKQDQRALNENWMTGFDNRDRLRELANELAQITDEASQQQEQFGTTKGQLKTLEQLILLLSTLESLEFGDIDVKSAERLLIQLQQHLEQLQDPNSDTARAKQQWEAAKAILQQIRQNLLESEQKISRLQVKQEQATQRVKSLLKQMGSGLSTEQQTLAAGHFKAISIEEIDQLDEQQREANSQLQKRSQTASTGLSSSINRLIRLMGTAKQKDTGALSEVGTEICDIPNYLQQLQLLTKEALPEKVERFLAYLNKSSDEGVTQLLVNIENGVSMIEERIDELNRTMVKVDFQPGHYLQLRPKRVIHETLTSIQKAQRQLRSAALKEDEGESHYRALIELVGQLRDAVERKKTQGARALLDPRYRLQFSVAVIKRDGEQVIEVRTGSQGGSGGEKEIITSYILTASLSYALCPDGMGRPLFGTVILDEAFSKSSQAVAARIIDALRQFGLHPLFITPNKEMRLLRLHTHSAILVHRRGLRATTTSLSWDELDQQAKKRLENV
ncbi:MAG: hypothetical protein L3J28_04330 [Candidatus Polarisedimenticolaceae bacterium]|nr:hypothetical protein [Candidatus Polarisedimenticolaceae bacterium]